MDQTAEQVCRKVYEETRVFYAEKAPQLGDAAYGFRVLYGPPLTNAPILFIGFQPGGSTQSAEQGLKDGEHEGWPMRCEYAVAPWRLASRLREIWDIPTLERCTGLNAIFFRAPSITAWNGISPKLRSEIEAFSLARAARVTRALAPQRIVIIGLGTFDRLTRGYPELVSDHRVLVKRGELWGAPAFGIVHVSGARVSRNDIAKLKGYFSKWN